MMKMLTDLSSSVKVTKDQKRELGVFPAVRLSTSHSLRRRARCQMSPDEEPDL